LRGAAQSIIDGAMFSDVASPAIDELVEEVLKRQGLIKFTHDVDEKCWDVLKTIRKG